MLQLQFQEWREIGQCVLEPEWLSRWITVLLTCQLQWEISHTRIWDFLSASPVLHRCKRR